MRHRFNRYGEFCIRIVQEKYLSISMLMQSFKFRNYARVNACLIVVTRSAINGSTGRDVFTLVFKGLRMPIEMFRPSHKLHGKKLECWKTGYLVLGIGFSSLVVFVIGSLVALFVQKFVMVAHDDTPSVDAVLKFLFKASLAAALAMLLLFFLLFASRAMKVLGERWFP